MSATDRDRDLCSCGHTRTSHTYAGGGSECADCPNGTCIGRYPMRLTWTDADACREIRRLRTDIHEHEVLTARLEALLNGVADALRGPAKPGTLHDWSRLPAEAAVAVAPKRCGDPYHEAAADQHADTVERLGQVIARAEAAETRAERAEAALTAFRADIAQRIRPLDQSQ